MAVLATVDSPDDVMAVPSRYLRDLLAADRTQTLLLHPEAEEFLITFEVRFHLHI